MDIMIFVITVSLSLIFTFLFTIDKSNPFLIIAAGILFLLAGIPLVAFDTLNYPVCDYVISNYTVVGNTTTYNNTALCTRVAAQIDWKLQEALGLLFILIGLGLSLSVFNDRKGE